MVFSSIFSCCFPSRQTAPISHEPQPAPISLPAQAQNYHCTTEKMARFFAALSFNGAEVSLIDDAQKLEGLGRFVKDPTDQWALQTYHRGLSCGLIQLHPEQTMISLTLDRRDQRDYPKTTIVKAHVAQDMSLNEQELRVKLHPPLHLEKQLYHTIIFSKVYESC